MIQEKSVEGPEYDLVELKAHDQRMLFLIAEIGWYQEKKSAYLIKIVLFGHNMPEPSGYHDFFPLHNNPDNDSIPDLLINRRNAI